MVRVAAGVLWLCAGCFSRPAPPAPAQGADGGTSQDGAAATEDAAGCTLRDDFQASAASPCGDWASTGGSVNALSRTGGVLRFTSDGGGPVDVSCVSNDALSVAKLSAGVELAVPLPPTSPNIALIVSLVGASSEACGFELRGNGAGGTGWTPFAADIIYTQTDAPAGTERWRLIGSAADAVALEVQGAGGVWSSPLAGQPQELALPFGETAFEVHLDFKALTAEAATVEIDDFDGCP